MRDDFLTAALLEHSGEAYDVIKAETPGLGQEIDRCIGQFGCALALVIRAQLDSDELTAQLARTRLLQVVQEVFVMADMEPPKGTR